MTTKEILKNLGKENPAYLSLLIQNKLSEGGPPKDGGIGSGNWIRHTSPSATINPFFDRIKQADELLRGQRGSRHQETRPEKVSLENLPGWQKLKDSDSEETKKIKSYANTKILATEVHNRLCQDFLKIQTPSVNIFMAQTKEEFEKRFGENYNNRNFYAFCELAGYPNKLPTACFQPSTMENLSNEQPYSPTVTGEFTVIAHEYLHGIAKTAEGQFVGSELAHAINPNNTLIPPTFKMSREMFNQAYELSGDLFGGRREGMKYTLGQLNNLALIPEQKSLSAFLKQAEKLGFDPEDLKGKDTNDPFKSARNVTSINLDKEEAVTELLARKFTVEYFSDAHIPDLGSYQDEVVVTLANMLEKHAGDRDSILEDLKGAKTGDKKTVEDWSNSLKYGIEALNSPLNYKHIMTKAKEHGIISEKEFGDIRWGKLTPDEKKKAMEFAKFAYSYSKEDLKEYKKTLDKLDFERQPRLEKKLVKWFLKPDKD